MCFRAAIQFSVLEFSKIFEFNILADFLNSTKIAGTAGAEWKLSKSIFKNEFKIKKTVWNFYTFSCNVVKSNGTCVLK